MANSKLTIFAFSHFIQCFTVFNCRVQSISFRSCCTLLSESAESNLPRYVATLSGLAQHFMRTTPSGSGTAGSRPPRTLPNSGVSGTTSYRTGRSGAFARSGPWLDGDHTARDTVLHARLRSRSSKPPGTLLSALVTDCERPRTIGLEPFVLCNEDRVLYVLKITRVNSRISMLRNLNCIRIWHDLTFPGGWVKKSKFAHNCPGGEGPCQLPPAIVHYPNIYCSETGTYS